MMFPINVDSFPDNEWVQPESHIIVIYYYTSLFSVLQQFIIKSFIYNVYEIIKLNKEILRLIFLYPCTLFLCPSSLTPFFEGKKPPSTSSYIFVSPIFVRRAAGFLIVFVPFSPSSGHFYSSAHCYTILFVISVLKFSFSQFKLVRIKLVQDMFYCYLI